MGDLPAHRRPQLAQTPRPRAAPRVRADPAHLRRQGAALPLHARHGATCSRSGRRSGRSPTTRASSRPTTTPNAPLRAAIYRKLSLSSQSDAGERSHRTAAVDPHHLPPATPQPARLPQRRHHRTHARRPRAPPRLTATTANRGTERSLILYPDRTEPDYLSADPGLDGHLLDRSHRGERNCRSSPIAESLRSTVTGASATEPKRQLPACSEGHLTATGPHSLALRYAMSAPYRRPSCVSVSPASTMEFAGCLRKLRQDSCAMLRSSADR